MDSRKKGFRGDAGKTHSCPGRAQRDRSNPWSLLCRVEQPAWKFKKGSGQKHKLVGVSGDRKGGIKIPALRRIAKPSVGGCREGADCPLLIPLYPRCQDAGWEKRSVFRDFSRFRAASITPEKPAGIMRIPLPAGKVTIEFARKITFRALYRMVALEVILAFHFL
jgi:hypothetical protein